MSESPFPPFQNGRGPDGRFAAGNKGGPGNPALQRVHQLRTVLAECVSDRDFRTVVKKLLAQAKKGNIDAIKELLNRLLGKPPASLELSGPEGEPLGMSLADVQLAVWEALADMPDARVKVAAKLRALGKANESARMDGAGA
jgi:hypothetical protein